MYNGIRPVSKYSMTIFVFSYTGILENQSVSFQYRVPCDNPKPHKYSSECYIHMCQKETVMNSDSVSITYHRSKSYDGLLRNPP